MTGAGRATKQYRASNMNSGRNQHYIPSFLQRAFGIPGKSKSRMEIWRFGLDGQLGRGRIKETGSGDYFYSRPSTDGRRTLDDIITAIEADLSRVLRAVRSRSMGVSIDAEEAAAIVSHMLGRTAHVRSSYRDLVDHLLKRGKALFVERANFEKLVGLDSDAPTRRFRELVVSDLARRPEVARLGIPLQLLERVAFVLLKETSTELLGPSLDWVAGILDEVRSRSGELVRDGHNRALEQAVKSNAYEALLRTFEWTVEHAPESGAILPDCVVIAFGADGRASTHLFVGGEELRAVVMAVSPEKLLVGCKPGFELASDFDYNVEAARLSHSFFLAPRNDTETSSLHAKIGGQFRLALEASIEGALEELLPKKDGDERRQAGPDVGAFGMTPESGANYKSSPAGAVEEDPADRTQLELKALVADVARNLPLERLDGITVGSDYPALLRAVDRGLDGVPVAETISPKFGTGIAQTVMVKRSGVIKGRVVMSSVVGEALISDDAEAANWAVRIVVNQMAQVALIGIVDERLPGRLLAPLESEMDAWLYANVDGAAAAYAASRIAAGYGDGRESGDELRESLAVGLDRLGSVVAEERMAYSRHGDMTKLLGVVLPAVRQVLRVAADLLGQCSLSGESPFDESGTLPEALDRLQLANWFRFYEDHLKRFHRRLGRWESFDEFLAFNLHVERLLWSVGMFAWESPNGLRIEIPPDWDSRAFDALRVGP